jgi:flagellar basal body-associated protein FliL
MEDNQEKFWKKTKKIKEIMKIIMLSSLTILIVGLCLIFLFEHIKSINL